jgi:dihydrofolate synthase/folylpolyglutamate synthase
VAAELELPGRLELREGDPPAVLDAAHNPQGAGALAEALPEVADGRPVVACMAMLEKKDAESVIAALAPAIGYAVATQIPPERLSSAGRPGARTIAAEQLAKLCRDAGIDAEAVPDPVAAVERAREVAREHAGIALFTGSHYLLAYG